MNELGRIGMARLIAGATTSLPRSSAPWILDSTATDLPCSESFFAARSLRIHRSSPTLATTYSASGSTQRFVWPNTVSGRIVAATRNRPSARGNLSNVYSIGVSPSPSSRSWSPIGAWSFGHQMTGCLSIRTYPPSLRRWNCQRTNASYGGLSGVVMKDRVQSTAAPRAFRSAIVAAGKTSIQCIGSANFGISRSGMPIARRISHCFGSFSAIRFAAPRIGRPVQWNPWGWSTLYPSIRRKRDWNSARRNEVPNPRCWYPFMYGYGTVEYHFGRPASARATYTCSRSHTDCHFASIFGRWPGSATLRAFAGARASACDRAFLGRIGARRGLGLARDRGRTLRLAARRDCDLFRRPRRARDFFATRAHRSDSRKAFRGVSERGSTLVRGSAEVSSIWHTK